MARRWTWRRVLSTSKGHTKVAVTAPAMAPAIRLTTSGSSQCLLLKGLANLHPSRPERNAPADVLHHGQQHDGVVLHMQAAHGARGVGQGTWLDTLQPLQPLRQCSAKVHSLLQQSKLCCTAHVDFGAHHGGTLSPEPIQHGPGRPCCCCPSSCWSGVSTTCKLRGCCPCLSCPLLDLHSLWAQHIHMLCVERRSSALRGQSPLRPAPAKWPQL